MDYRLKKGLATLAGLSYSRLAILPKVLQVSCVGPVEDTPCAKCHLERRAPVVAGKDSSEIRHTPRSEASV